MKQRRIKFKGILIILFILVTACGKEGDQGKKDIESSGHAETQEAEQLSIDEWHTSLNSQESLMPSLKEEEKEQIVQILTENQSEYAEMPYSGELVPQGLISRLEEALYAYCKFGEERSDQPYREAVEELGGDSYRMTEEEIQKTFIENLPNRAFTFRLSNGRRMYLKTYFLQEGGAVCYLWSKSGKNWFFKGEFMTMFTRGEVIYYEDTYYYIGLEPAREEDGESRENGIRIFRLDEQMKWSDNLLIRYVPEEYKRVPLSTIEEKEGAADYIESLDALFTLNKAMDTCGSAEEMIEIIEEGEVPSVKKYSYADMMNIGIPIYMKKAYAWNHIYNWYYLKIDFYLYDVAANQFILLDNWEDGCSKELRREYLWCEELGGKIYTFQLFRLEDYTYIFDVLLLEGNQARKVHREVWTPHREMHFKEGEELSPVM